MQGELSKLGVGIRPPLGELGCVTRGKSLPLSGLHLPPTLEYEYCPALPGATQGLHEATCRKLPCQPSSPGQSHFCVLEQ